MIAPSLVTIAEVLLNPFRSIPEIAIIQTDNVTGTLCIGTSSLDVVLKGAPPALTTQDHSGIPSDTTSQLAHKCLISPVFEILSPITPSSTTKYPFSLAISHADEEVITFPAQASREMPKSGGNTKNRSQILD